MRGCARKNERDDCRVVVLAQMRLASRMLAGYYKPSTFSACVTDVLPWRVRCAAPSKNNKKRARVLLKLAAAQGHERARVTLAEIDLEVGKDVAKLLLLLDK